MAEIILLIIVFAYLGYSIWYNERMDKILNDIKEITKNSSEKE